MGLSRKVLQLWNVRVFVLLVLLFPVSDYLPIGRFWSFLILLLTLLSAFVLFYIRYKACVFKVAKKGITLYTGVIIRKELYIKYSHVLSVSRLYTPLSKHLGLSNLVIYCEGATFLLPPLPLSIISIIEENIKAEVTKNGT